MAQDNKVVNFTGKNTVDRFSLPVALVRLRDASGQALRDVLAEFFDRADDSLFSMADKAATNSDQIAYFDAMRELRLRRKNMTVAILQRVSRAFNELGSFDPIPGASGLDSFSQESLTLMAHSELEQKVAIDSLINKLRAHYAETIHLLEVRVSHLVPGCELHPRQMPLSPEVICSALAESCVDLDVDIRAKLIVLKLFDKLLISNLQAFYVNANRLLVDEGVLPDMSRPPLPENDSRNPQARQFGPAVLANATAAPGGDRIADDPAGVSFSELSALLHEEGAPAAVPAGQGAVAQLDTASLLSQLGRIQNDILAMSKTPVSGPPAVVPLNEQLRPLLEAQGEQRYSFQQVDRDVINLVSMLFDFILEDEQLSPLMKAAISRLQVPMLRVALTDQSFFNRGGHPARKLLNDLAMAGIGWSEKGASQRDPLKVKIESVIERLLEDYTDDPALFSDVLDEFSHFMDLDRRRRQLVEQRLRDAEEGRALQEQARAAVDRLLAEIIDQRRIPDAVSNLLDEPWRKYLQWVVLRKGQGSDLWKQATELTRRLVWTVDPQPVDKQTRSRLLQMIPAVVDELRDALSSISWDPFAIDKSIRDLELAHVDVFQLLAGQVAPPKPVEAPEPPAEERPDTAPVMTVVPTEAPPATPATAASQPPLAEEWLRKADALPVGSWVEMMVGETRIRCKLVAFIKATGKYIFVNRNGAKVAEYHRDSLAQALAMNEVSVLDDGLIFDRALESIIDNLRSSRGD
ncbi:DUF1631 domain-containing protein [Marinobacter sp. X15-166B]|uniref:DUF1631 domain-containing protein n=1 Tax=Marinobacter sp. X15-166B TaxID=1897620 RepID=UPI00085BE213|nr:DUF1631 domain-containing protein [Marinobacter sp. X15-166B]OEY67790.1 hypothetical protein BG841_16075 [Marinobacter sp. X15-166B]